MMETEALSLRRAEGLKENMFLGRWDCCWEVAQMFLPDWAGLLSQVVIDRLFAVSASLRVQYPKLLIRQTLLFGSQYSVNP